MGQEEDMTNDGRTLNDLSEVLRTMGAEIRIGHSGGKCVATVFDGWSDGIGEDADIEEAIAKALFAFGVNQTLDQTA